MPAKCKADEIRGQSQLNTRDMLHYADGNTTAINRPNDGQVQIEVHSRHL